MISTSLNIGSPFEANEGGRANRGYEVDEGVRDGVTSPLLAALQDHQARGSPAEDDDGRWATGDETVLALLASRSGS